MKRLLILVCAAALLAAAASAQAITSSQILAQVKQQESGFSGFKADMDVEDVNEDSVGDFGKGYDNVLLLQKAKVYFKKPDKIRFEGLAKGIKVTYIQNGYKKLILASMLRKLDDVKNDPGKRQSTLDLGFLSSKLWTDNHVSVVASGKDYIKIKFDPKFGDKDKRHDMVWVDPKTLKMKKRETYRGSGEMRVSTAYSQHKSLGSGLQMATRSKLYAPDGRMLGIVCYKNIDVNPALSDSLFSLSTR